MDPTSSDKLYYVDDFEPKDILKTYGSPDSDPALYEEITVFPLKALQKLLSSGKIKGTTLTDFSDGPLISHLLEMAEYFKDIVILKPNYLCILEMEKWQYGGDDPFDWTHLSELEGDRNKWLEKEASAKSKIRNIMKCDLSKENPVDPFVLAKADCVTCFFSMGQNSIDKPTYKKNVRKILSMLKPGGRLILTGTFNTKFYFIGNQKFHSLSFDEKFLREVLEELGCIIEDIETFDSKASSDKAKYDKVFLVNAVKDKEV